MVLTHLLTGAGAIVSLLKTCTGRTPTVLGKPEPLLLRLIGAAHPLPAGRTVVVGDRLDTDIAFARNGGLDALMVLTGVSSLQEAKTGEIRPHMVLDSFGLLAPVS
jgi:ribonucleotide monophosphatase NagD (HAD superfamily)